MSNAGEQLELEFDDLETITQFSVPKTFNVMGVGETRMIDPIHESKLRVFASKQNREDSPYKCVVRRKDDIIYFSKVLKSDDSGEN